MAFLANLFNQYPQPPEYDFGWKMKSTTSAQTNFTIDDQGVFELTIIHDIIKGVTPKMLLWWFKNIGGEMVYQGKTYSRYQVWHPKDHIHWELVGPTVNKEIGVGSCFRIVEAFGRDMKCLIHSKEFVEKLDETGIRLVMRMGGIEVFSLQHDFIEKGNDTLYKSRMIVGTRRFPLNRIFNACIRPMLFTKQMGYAWLKHNIEEVGNFEFFLPELYHNEQK